MSSTAKSLNPSTASRPDAGAVAHVSSVEPTYPVTVAFAVISAAMAPAYVLRFHLSFYPTTALEIAILLTFAAFAIESFRAAQWPAWRSPIVIPTGVFLLAGAISILTAPSHLAALGIYRAYLVEPILFAIVLMNALRTPRQAHLVVVGFCAGAGVLAVAQSAVVLRGILNHTFDLSLAPQSAPPVAIYTAANAIALYLVPVVAVAAALLVHEADRRLRLVLAAFMVIVVPSVILTFSRGGWVAMGVVAFGLVLSVRRRWLWLGVLLAVVVALALVPAIRHRAEADLQFGPNQTLDGRTPLWAASLRMLASRPLFGAGLSGFFQRMQEAGGSYQNILTYPHNIVLNFWSETGLLGVVSFGALFLVVMWMSLQGWRHGAAGWRPLHLGVLLATVAIFVHGLVDVPYFKNDLAFQFWAIVGLTLAGWQAAASAGLLAREHPHPGPSP